MYFCVTVKDMNINDYGQSYDIILAFIRFADAGEPCEIIQPEEIKRLYLSAYRESVVECKVSTLNLYLFYSRQLECPFVRQEIHAWMETPIICRT